MASETGVAIAAPALRGEEFRDDTRQVAGRVLSGAELTELTTLDNRVSAKAILLTVGVLTAALMIGAWAWTPWIVIPCALVIAAQQHALFVLAHDAAHYRLFRSRSVNDAVGRLIGSVAGISMCAYRVIHRLHHNHLYGPQDPDIALHGGYPRGKRYLLRKLATDLSGLTAWKTYKYFFGAPAGNADTGSRARPLDDTSPALRAAALADRRGVIAFQVGMPIVAWAFGGPDGLLRYAVLWLLPLATLLQALLRLRAIAEHGAPAGFDSPLVAARTHVPTALSRFFLFPHHVGYHIEHHLYPAAPHYRLPALHEALRSRGVLEAAEVESFSRTWGRVYADRVRADAPAVARTDAS